MGFHVFSVISVVFKQEPQSFYADVVNRMPGLVEVVGDRFVPVVLDVSHSVHVNLLCVLICFLGR